MKKIRYVAFAAVLALLCLSLFGCVRLNRVEKPVSENNYQQDNNEAETQKVSLVEMTSTGEISYDKFLRNVIYSAEFLAGDADLFPFKYNSQYGYADATGKIIISDKYDKARVFSEGKAFVEINGRWKIIDINGNELYNIPEKFYEAADYFEGTSSNFKNGKAIFACKETIKHSEEGMNTDILKALVVYEDMSTEEIEITTEENLSYKIVNTPDFSGFITYNLDKIEYEENTYKGVGIYRLFDLNGKEIWRGYPDPNQRTIANEYYTAMGQPSKRPETRLSNELDVLSVNNGYMNVFDKNLKWGLLNVNTGELEIECKYDFVGSYSNGLCNICSYGKWGYADLNGNEVIEPKYKYTEAFVNNLALIINENGFISTIDTKGSLISETTEKLSETAFQKHNVIYSNMGKSSLNIIYNGDDKFLILSNTGEILIKRSFDKLQTVLVTDNYIFVDSQVHKIEK